MDDIDPKHNRDTFRGRGERIKELEEQVEQLKQKLLERPAMTEDEMAKEIAEMSDEEVKANVDRVFGDDLARRAVKCKTWRWMPGMLCSWDPPARSGGQQIMPTSARVADIPTGQLSIMHCVVDKSYVYRAAFPVLTDPATLGCLLHLVREHWGDGGAHTKRFCRYGGGEKWICYAPSVFYPTLQTVGDTEAEALVKALETEVPKND